MKVRPVGFLSEEKIPHDSEAFAYITELHGYLWRLVYAAMPDCGGGNLSDYIDAAIGKIESEASKRR